MPRSSTCSLLALLLLSAGVGCGSESSKSPQATASPETTASVSRPEDAAAEVFDAAVADAQPIADAAPEVVPIAPVGTVPRATWPELALAPGETSGGVLDKLQLTPPETTPKPGPDGIARSAPTRWVSKRGHAVLVSVVFTESKAMVRAQWFDPKPRQQDVVTIKGTIRGLREPYINDFVNGELVVVMNVDGDGKNVEGKHAYRLSFDPKRGFRVVKRRDYQGNDRGNADSWILHSDKELATTIFPRSTNNRVQSLRSYNWTGFSTKVITVKSDGTETAAERPIESLLAEWVGLGGLPTMPYDWKCDSERLGCCESTQAKDFAPLWHIDRVCFAKGPHGPVFGQIRVREPR